MGPDVWDLTGAYDSKCLTNEMAQPVAVAERECWKGACRIGPFGGQCTSGGEPLWRRLRCF